MTVDEVAEYLESLPGVRRGGTEERPVWRVQGRLVARLVDPTTLLVRAPMSRREALVESDPDGFGVPPRLEAHHKVEAYLDRADPAAVRTAIRLAWELQHRGGPADRPARIRSRSPALPCRACGATGCACPGVDRPPRASDG